MQHRSTEEPNVMGERGRGEAEIPLVAERVRGGKRLGVGPCRHELCSGAAMPWLRRERPCTTTRTEIETCPRRPWLGPGEVADRVGVVRCLRRDRGHLLYAVVHALEPVREPPVDSRRVGAAGRRAVSGPARAHVSFRETEWVSA